MKKHIVAIGGGGFGRSIENLKIESYIRDLAMVQKPKVCFVPTASGEDDSYKVNFYNVFTKLNCEPSHIDFFKRTTDLEEHIADQDIVYVGGGNTKSMIAIWKEWGFDLILKKAYERGVIMSGVSAGAICWFTKGITDSWANKLAVINCLDFVKGNCCPHYDEEKERKPFVNMAINQRLIDTCIAIEGGCALHITDGECFKSISFGDSKKVYAVSMKNNKITSTLFKQKQI